MTRIDGIKESLNSGCEHPEEPCYIDMGEMCQPCQTALTTNITYLLQGMDATRPVIEWAATQPCLKWEGEWPEKNTAPSYCLQFDQGVWDTCPPCLARAWKKEYYPEEIS